MLYARMRFCEAQKVYEPGRQYFESAPESRAHECVIFACAPNTDEKRLFASAEGASGESFEDFCFSFNKKPKKLYL